ncbi:hypothetical protein THTE_3364 [Thermogutta terrifontis]|uniref:Uncharacterized protein n=1 Tax=Thermogutta terrifontis TaxID=1331910 RepID=A0A286RJ40_9BACT|nr:hypothetical protein THTE_3364 [Thermogutta terrifontis]
MPELEHNRQPAHSSSVGHKVATTTCTRTHSPRNPTTGSRPLQARVFSPWCFPPVTSETGQQQSTTTQ